MLDGPNVQHVSPSGSVRYRVFPEGAAIVCLSTVARGDYIPGTYAAIGRAAVELTRRGVRVDLRSIRPDEVDSDWHTPLNPRIDRAEIAETEPPGPATAAVVSRRSVYTKGTLEHSFVERLRGLDGAEVAALRELIADLPERIRLMPVTAEALWIGYALLAAEPMYTATRHQLNQLIAAHEPMLSALRAVPTVVAAWRAIAAHLGEAGSVWEMEAGAMETRAPKRRE